MKQKLFSSLVLTTMLATSLSMWAVSGTSTENMPGQGVAFQSNGYSYEFTTSGKSVTIKFTLLDTYEGVQAYLWDYTNGFLERGMSYDGTSKTASITLTNQTPASTLSFACKFAFSGGMSVTKQFSYTVEGEDTGGGDDDDKPTGAYCQGSDTVSTDGQPFTDGYDYLMQTIQSGEAYSVLVTVKLKDDRTGVVAYMQDFTSGGLVETPINFDVASKSTTYTFSGVEDLAELNFRVKFAYAGGLSTTKAFVYTVGTDCNGQRPQQDEDDEEDETTGMENANVNANVNRKVMMDGQLLIIREGKMYNAQGALL